MLKFPPSSLHGVDVSDAYIVNFVVAVFVVIVVVAVLIVVLVVVALTVEIVVVCNHFFYNYFNNIIHMNYCGNYCC